VSRMEQPHDMLGGLNPFFLVNLLFLRFTKRKTKKNLTLKEPWKD